MAVLPRAAGLLAAAFLFTEPSRAALPELTEAERGWLARNPVVRVGVDRNGAPPIDVPGSDGNHYGISAEVLRRIANRLDVRLEFRAYKDLAAALAGAQRREVDVVPSIQRTAENAGHFLFTQHYVYSHTVLLKHGAFATTPVPTIALVRGRFPADVLGARLPQYRALEMPDATAAIAAVTEGRAQAYAGSILPVLHAWGDGAAAQLASLREEVLDAGELRLAVRDDQPLLASALDRGLGSFTTGELAEIARQWRTSDAGVRPRVPAFVMREDEKRFVEKLGTVRVAMDPGFEPFSFLQAGEPAGMSIDYLRAAAERIGARLEFLRAQTFGQALDAVLEGNAEVLAAAARTSERRRYLRFAGPTFSQPTAIITRLDTEYVTGLADLEPQRVALPDGYFLRERLAREFPQARVIGCRDTEDCLQAVVDGRAMATLGNLAVISTLIERRFPGRLRVAGTVPDSPSELYFAVAVERPMLQSLLQRALDSLPPEKHDQIRTRWRTAQYQEGISLGKVLRVGLPVLAAVLLVLGFIIYSNRRLAAEVAKRRATEAELRVARDRAEAATQAKSAFLAVMSHEIRTPMHGVLGILDVLGHTQLTGDQKGLVKTAGNSARSLLVLLNDLLDFSKIEAGKMRLDPAPASLRVVAESVVNLFAMKAYEKGVQLTLSVDPALAPSHRFDEVRVGQVLTNLVSNAVKFTSAGTVSVEIAAREDGPGFQQVDMRVRDSGIGIAQEDQAKLFEAFEQAESSTTRRYGGSGLGLAICRRIAELMEGAIRLESAKGTGSTFTFSARLPVAANVAAAGLDASPGRPRRRARILVVEDHPVNQLVVRRQLEHLGHEVEIADNGGEGLAKWRAGSFDLVLADHHMPVMDGVEMVRHMRAEEASTPGAKKTPVLGLSADVLEPMPEVDGRLVKPIVTGELARAIAGWLPGLEPSPIDEGQLREALGNDEAVAATLAALRDSLAADLEALRTALRDRRMDEARRMAHRILGAARAVGATRLESAAARMQEAAVSTDFALAAGAFEELAAARDEVVETIEDKMPR